MYKLCNICKKCKKCNLYQICTGFHVGNRVGDGSWCRHVRDNNSSAASSTEVDLLEQDANASLVKREMPVWAAYIQIRHQYAQIAAQYANYTQYAK